MTENDYYSLKCNFLADLDNVASCSTPSRRPVSPPWKKGAEMFEDDLYISLANNGIVALDCPPWINVVAMVEDCPCTSFANIGIAVLLEMVPA